MSSNCKDLINSQLNEIPLKIMSDNCMQQGNNS